MLDTKRRGRRKGIQIREGSVRQARLEAQLTLAQVADGQLTRAAIHLIEVGRTRPSRETLELIARQTHRPLEFFLETRQGSSTDVASADTTALDELERLTASRDFARVIDVGSAMVADVSGEAAGAMLHFYLGQAYCRLVQPAAALKHLPGARRSFEFLGDEFMAVEALDWEASAQWMLEDPRAIPLAMEALERCRRLDPRPAPTEARILGHLGGMHVSTHSWRHARGFYEAAIEAAGAVRDLLQLAKMHHGLGTVYQRLQQPTRARKHFDKAVALYSIDSDVSALQRVENDLGELLLREGQFEAAEARFRSALAGAESIGLDRRGRGYILTNLGETLLKKGRLGDAEAYLLEALDVSEATGERLVYANAHVVLAELREAQALPMECDRHFTLGLAAFVDLKMPDRLQESEMRYAELLERRGDFVSAGKHWRVAALVSRSVSLGQTAPGEAESTAQTVKGLGA